MIREEAIAIIRKEYLCVDRDCDIERSCGKCDLMMPSKEPILEAYKMAIKALEQEPTDHIEYGTNRNAYKLWISNGKEYEPGGDTISRSDVLDAIGHGTTYTSEDLQRIIKGLLSVNPQPKTGHWIKTIGENGVTSAVRCSECGFEDNRYMLFKYCPNCSCCMVEPQGSEDKG